MKKEESLQIVIFGATGNLYADKLARALFLLFEEGDSLPKDFKIIAFARRDIGTLNFRALTKEYILKKGEVSPDVLEDFLSHIEYFQGELTSKDDFINLKNYLSTKEADLTMFHLATPSFLYQKIFENIKDSLLYDMGRDIRLMIEKPFGKDEVDAKKLQELLASFLGEEQIYNIDHYLAKETVRRIPEVRFGNNKTDLWIPENVSKVKIIFHESNVVGSRGSFYDTVGAFRDVGENHMLEMLALVLMDKKESEEGEISRKARASVLNKLYVDDTQPMIKGQYASYLLSPGVESNSKTETFFRIFLKSHDPRFTDAIFELESGKGLVDLGSNITSTTVSINVYLDNGRMEEFKIQPLPGTSYDSYEKVYADAINGNQDLFVSMDEIVSQWRLADELLEKWKDMPLIIYKDGSNPKDIR